MEDQAQASAGERPAAVDSPSRLTAQQTTRVANLAKLRGDSFDRAYRHAVDYVGLKSIPGTFKSYHLPKDWGFKSLRVEGAYHASIALKNGRVLTGYRSDARFQRFYACVSDLLPAGVDAETYEVYVESSRRYGRAVDRQHIDFLPPKDSGGVMVDAGAYLGFKGIGYADHLGPNGRTIVIEIDPVSEALARRNIEQNGLQDRMQSFCCAIWNKDQEAADHGGAQSKPSFDRVRNTLSKIDEHPTWTVGGAIATRSLDSIFRQAGVDRIDYLNMQLNGAETDAVDGLVEYFDKVRVLYAAAAFHARGKPLNAPLAAKLEARGCWVKKTDHFIIAVTPRYREMYGVA